MKTRVVLAFAPSLLGIFLLNCSDPDLCEGAQCAADGGASGDGGSDATTDATVADGGPDAHVSPPGCDAGADLADQTACVVDSAGIFVSTSGSDSAGAGTKESPYATIGKALGALSGEKSSVFVCVGTYTQPVILTASANILGGFDCSTWAHSTTTPSVIAPTSPGYALQLTNANGVTLEDLEFHAKDGSNAGDSSVAVFAAGSTATFRRVKATAGNAEPATAQAATGANYSAAQAPSGTPDQGGTLAPPQTCTSCADNTYSYGGASGAAGSGTGGSGNPGGANYGDGGLTLGPASPADGTTNGAGGVFNTSTGHCTAADDGVSGTPATGGAGATSYGVLNATGWSPSVGKPGSVGGVAQGGGGGSGGPISGSGASATGAGGGGGCGGCGGGGGAAGTGGGSSFAVLSYMSTFSFDTCTLATANAAAGGTGGDGQSGQQGGTHGAASGAGCTGGFGGNGGRGAGGGGGAGDFRSTSAF